MKNPRLKNFTVKRELLLKFMQMFGIKGGDLVIHNMKKLKDN